MKLNAYQRLVLLSLAILLPKTIKVYQKLQIVLFKCAKVGEIDEDNLKEEIFSKIH